MRPSLLIRARNFSCSPMVPTTLTSIWVLAQQGSLSVYDIWRKLRAQRDFTYIRYQTVNRRVRALEERGYVEKSGERKTKTGFAAKLYQLTARVYLAILLDKIDLDNFVEKALDESVISAIAALASYS